MSYSIVPRNVLLYGPLALKRLVGRSFRLGLRVRRTQRLVLRA